MECSLGERLDIGLLKKAWLRVQHDMGRENYINYPFLQDVLNFDKEQWLESISKSIINSTYVPSSCRLIHVPKAGKRERPGHILDPKDAVVYSALLLDAFGHIKDKIAWSASQYIRYSTELTDGMIRFSEEDYYVRDRYRDIFPKGRHPDFPWIDFQNDSICLVKGGYTHVVFLDLSKFYENIDIQRLLSDLRDMGVAEDNLSLLSQCLIKWTTTPNKGVPQGYVASEVLAGIYLDSIDRQICDLEEINFKRYADDMRIFCKSQESAEYALQQIKKYCQDKGLTINTDKTCTLEGEAAIKELNIINVTFPEIEQRIEEEWDKAYDEVEGEFDCYETQIEIFGIVCHTPPPHWAVEQCFSEREKNLRKEGNLPNLPILIEAFRKHYMEKNTQEEASDFDKSQFRFIINRLGRRGDRCAVDYCIEALYSHPEETRAILKYLTAFKKDKRLVETVAKRLVSDDAVDFQHYAVVKWAYDNRLCSRIIKDYSRKVIGDRKGTEQMAWHYCVAYLGRYNDKSDLAIIERSYSKDLDDVSKSTIICSLLGLNKWRRESLYEKGTDGGYLIISAINYARARTLSVNHTVK